MCKNSKLSLICTFVAIFRKVSGSAVRLSGVSSQGSGCRLDGLASGSPCGGGDGQQVSRWRPRRAYIIYKRWRRPRPWLSGVSGQGVGSRRSPRPRQWLALLSMVSRWRGQWLALHGLARLGSSGGGVSGGDGVRVSAIKWRGCQWSGCRLSTWAMVSRSAGGDAVAMASRLSRGSLASLSMVSRATGSPVALGLARGSPRASLRASGQHVGGKNAVTR